MTTTSVHSTAALHSLQPPHMANMWRRPPDVYKRDQDQREGSTSPTMADSSILSSFVQTFSRSSNCEHLFRPLYFQWYILCYFFSLRFRGTLVPNKPTTATNHYVQECEMVWVAMHYIVICLATRRRWARWQSSSILSNRGVGEGPSWPAS